MLWLFQVAVLIIRGVSKLKNDKKTLYKKPSQGRKRECLTAPGTEISESVYWKLFL